MSNGIVDSSWNGFERRSWRGEICTEEGRGEMNMHDKWERFLQIAM